jgi:hypothetical protein
MCSKRSGLSVQDSWLLSLYTIHALKEIPCHRRLIHVDFAKYLGLVVPLPHEVVVDLLQTLCQLARMFATDG